MARRGSARYACLERSQVVCVEVDEAFGFFADAWNLEAITPPWLRFRILIFDYRARETEARLR